jgi:hypothetical protein
MNDNFLSNRIEMIPTVECVVVIITTPDGRIIFDRMTWPEYGQLRSALDDSAITD